MFLAHRALCQDFRILHRDISKNNLLLWHDPDVNRNHRRGLLIDYDYAEELDINGDFSLGTRTVSFTITCTSVVTQPTNVKIQGTGPFMSIEVLHNAGDKQIKQKPSHDLESIFYVLLYICTFFKGPDGMRRNHVDLEEMSSVAINDWFVMHKRFRDLADKKKGQLSQFETRFLNRFPSYFRDLRTCMNDLWNVLFPTPIGVADNLIRDLSSCVATHDGMLEVLRIAYDQLPGEDVVETDPVSESSGAKSLTKKRSANDDSEVRRKKKHISQDAGLPSGSASLNLGSVRRSTRLRKSASVGTSRTNERIQMQYSGISVSHGATCRNARRVKSTGSPV
jgi:hypothetical protein